MEIKVFELRDKGTFIPIVAIKMRKNNTPQEDYLCGRAGWERNDSRIVVMRADFNSTMQGCIAQYDPAMWYDRTFQTAHEYIQQRFDNLIPGQVIDVEFILDERSAPKMSEAFEE